MTDIEAIVRLENLKKIKRSDLKQGLVDAVLAQAVSFEDKIKRIEMIDQLPEEAAPVKKPRPAVKPERKSRRAAQEKEPDPESAAAAAVERAVQATPPPMVDPTLVESKRVEHYRRRLSKPPTIGGLWLYLIKEYGPMVRFGARTSTLARGMFPFTLKLSSEAIVFLTNTLGSQILPILDQTLPFLLKKSWLYLTKYEYNLLAGLRELTATARSVEVAEGDRTGGGQAWDPVIAAVRLFWTAPDVVSKTIGAWEQATSRLSVVEKTRLAGVDSIRTLLEARNDTQSLPDVLLALQMLRSRRMMAWDDKPDSGEYFARDTFDCAPDVQAEIDRAAEMLIGQLDVLAKEAQEIQRIRYYIPAEDLISEFDGGADRADVPLWCQGFLVRFNTAFTPLLEGNVTFAEGTQTVLFQNPSLSSTLARLRLLEEQLADADQAKNPELITSVARVLMNLGKTLVVVIRNRSQTADPLARAPDLAQPSDPLPFEEAVLDRPVEWAGLSVIDALVKSARMCIQVGRFLGETSLESSLEKEGTLPARSADLMTRLARLVPQARLEALKTRFPLA